MGKRFTVRMLREWVLVLTARTCSLQNCIALIPKTKEDRESGSRIPRNLFILNNMAERVGFEPAPANKLNKLGGANGTSDL